MSVREELVKEFNKEAGQTAIGIDFDVINFRIRLLKEEMEEVEEAADVLLYEHMCGKGGASAHTKAEMLKELCDLQYVLSGTLVALGFDENFDEAFARVHQSNLLKFPASYAPDGKVRKGPNYKPPHLEDLV